MSDVDFAHTPHAEGHRRYKAAALAAEARRLGLSDEDLTLGNGNRKRVLKAAGLRSASEETWFVVHELMTREDE